MRDILFKAKRIDNGEWVEGFYFCMVHNDGRHIHHFIMPLGADLSLGTPIEKIQVEIDIDTLCQYTGSSNKNRNKIWENDVVWINGTDRAIVIFSEKHSGYILQPIGDFYFDSPMLVDNVDIIDNCIGNIFDNPELLGV